jgi:hypothetical protein
MFLNQRLRKAPENRGSPSSLCGEGRARQGGDEGGDTVRRLFRQLQGGVTRTWVAVNTEGLMSALQFIVFLCQCLSLFFILGLSSYTLPTTRTASCFSFIESWWSRC